MLEELGASLWDPKKIVLVIDHYVPESDDESRRIVRIARDWAAGQQLPNVYDSVGICHVVVPQHGHIRPGMFCVGGDSHSPTGGAFGAYMFGIGSTEMLGVAVTGKVWVKVPQTLMMRWNGRLAAGVTAKDMMLHMIGRYGMNGGRYQAVEFCGEAVRALPMQERMTLSNMSAELGSQVGLIAPDETTAAYLRAAASVLRGRRLAPGMRLMVAPASRLDQQQAEQEGVMQVLQDAGAQVLATSCGACAGYGGSIPDDASVISTTARNFKGRMGSETAQVYLASPYTVAASAVAGRIADPREVMA